MKILLLFGLLLIAGCSGGVGEFIGGAAVGAGTSAATAQWQADMQKNKAALVAELIVLREKYDTVTTDAEQKAISAQFDVIQTKLSNLESGEFVANKVGEGTQQNWTDTSAEGVKSNAMWILDAVLGGLLLWEKRKSGIVTTEKKQLENGIASFSADSPAETSRALRNSITAKKVS